MMVENGTGLCTAISLYFIHDSTKKKYYLAGTLQLTCIENTIYISLDFFSDFKCKVTSFPTVATKLMIHRNIRSMKED